MGNEWYMHTVHKMRARFTRLLPTHSQGGFLLSMTAILTELFHSAKRNL